MGIFARHTQLCCRDLASLESFLVRAQRPRDTFADTFACRQPVVLHALGLVPRFAGRFSAPKVGYRSNIYARFTPYLAKPQPNGQSGAYSFGSKRHGCCGACISLRYWFFFCLMIGLFSRFVAPLAFLFAVSYAHRISPGAFFGLDKVNCMLAMYLLLGPCGARYSLDSLRRRRRGNNDPIRPSTSANLAIRLIQTHLCIIYLFSALAKLMGPNWQAGTAVWWALANQEYQSIGMTWLANWTTFGPIFIALATHATVFWELFYCCLIWNRYTRPLMLWMAVAIHAGIGLFMGMITFALAMLYANLAFLKPPTVRRWVDPLAGWVSAKLGGGNG